VLNNPEFLQSDLAEMVQKELEDSKMLQEKAMFKEVIRAKEGELYSTVKIEEVYKRLSLMLVIAPDFLYAKCMLRMHAQIITNIRMFSIFESVEKDSLLGNTGIFSLASYS
jgi:hypothetical protein